MSELRLPPLALYIHVPWCERKCPYCDFNSHEPRDALPEASYVSALLEDLQADLHWVQGRKLASIFIGGGTPSLLSEQAMSALLRGVRARLALRPDCEITLEANPGSAEAGKFAGFAEAGVNRLSLGVQSFDDDRLAALGRIHTASQAVEAVEMAREAGIRNLNLDLMHGLPGQGVAGACADLEQALALAPEHLSWYQLTIERNTAFWKHPPTLPAEEELAAIQTQGEALLHEAGYPNYEVSAYARSSYRCQHNLNYWQFGDYLGIGAGAHGKITRPGRGDILRTQKRRQPEHYLGARENAFLAHCLAMPVEQLVGDFMLNALRLTEGFDLAQFEDRTGLSSRALEPTLTRLAARDLLSVDGSTVRATALGRRYLDDVIGEFI